MDARLAGRIAGTAPLGRTGNADVSRTTPIASLRAFGERRLARLDDSGSGAGTIAHLRQRRADRSDPCP